MKENKNPAESGGCTLDSAGSTALRVVDQLKRQSNPQVYLCSGVIVLLIPMDFIAGRC